MVESHMVESRLVETYLVESYLTESHLVENLEKVHTVTFGRICSNMVSRLCIYNVCHFIGSSLGLRCLDCQDFKILRNGL